MTTDSYSLPKELFTELDFDTMGWHDNPIHAVAFGPGEQELSFDIDYIIKWEQPLPGEKSYRFWISPATLVFENLYNCQFNFDFPYHADLTILSLDRERVENNHSTKAVWKWTLDCLEAYWVFSATGYRQFIRKPPVLLDAQRFELPQRGGYNFECPPRP